MKLATLRHEKKLDGRLVLVSQDLKRCLAVPEIAATLQEALDQWTHVQPLLGAVYSALNEGNYHDDSELFFPENCLAPLPRSHAHWSMQAYAQESAGSAMSLQRGDSLHGPTHPLRIAAESSEMDFEAGLAVLTDAVDANVSLAQARQHARLLMLANTPRNRQSGSTSTAAPSFSPCAITPDELGSAWNAARIQLPLRCRIGGKMLGQLHCGTAMQTDFAAMIASAAQSAPLGAGSLLTTGRIREATSQPATEGGSGFSCLMDLRAWEQAAGKPRSAYLRHGDGLHISMSSAEGIDLFGTIEQTAEKN